MTGKLSRDIRILIVDDQPLLQNYLRHTLETLGYLGIQNVDYAAQALTLLEEKHFDLVICSFDLAGKDGYQLFQELKARNLYRQSCGFIFISAETEPSLVHSVLELQPDEFMVKPFSAKELKARIERTLRRKQQLKELFLLLDLHKHDEALEFIDASLGQKKYSSYHTLLLKMRGELLLRQQNYPEAELFYQTLLKTEVFGWAQLGLARCYLARGAQDEARELLNQLVEKPDYKLVSLDLLAQIYQQHQLFNQAQQELQQATAIAPRNLLRQQQLFNLCRLNHDYEHQYKTARHLVQYARHSMFEQPDLYLNLARSSIDYALTLGELEHTNRLSKVASEALVNLRKTFPSSHKEQEQQVIEARLFYLKDQSERAKQVLLHLPDSKPEKLEDALDKAKALHEVGLLSAAREVLSQAAASSQQELGVDPLVLRYVLQEQQERNTLPMGPREFNNNAVLMYERGLQKEALHAFIQAFKVMPSNVRIALNLLQALRVVQVDLSEKEKNRLIEECERLLSHSKLNQEQLQRWQHLQTSTAANNQA